MFLLIILNKKFIIYDILLSGALSLGHFYTQICKHVAEILCVLIITHSTDKIYIESVSIEKQEI